MRYLVLIFILISSATVSHEKDGSYFLSVTKVTYTVNDIEKASGWYSKVLHLEPESQDDKSVKFKVGEFELIFIKSGENCNPDSTVIYWSVEDVESDLARLVKLGATLKKPLSINSDGKKEALITDPFCNVIGLTEQPN